MFKLILALSAILVAGCAAYFSIQGLASLYAGSYLAVCIMASSLEIGKLVAASYLKRYWNETTIFLKLYLLISVFILMGITSIGIFGFLTSSYQKSHSKIEIIDTQRQTLENKKQIIISEKNNLNDRLKTLNDIRILQEQRVKESGNYKTPREQAYEAINKSDQEINDLQYKITKLNEQLSPIDIDLINLKTEESKSTDIGTLKFVSNLFNIDIETTIKWFTLIIVLVFDPLAVSLVLAYNSLIKEKNKTPKDSINNNLLKRIIKPFNVKYQDK
jgi:hypothetical protein